MKKLWTLALAALMLLSLAACGQKEEVSTQPASSAAPSTAEADDDAPLVREDDKEDTSSSSDTAAATDVSDVDFSSLASGGIGSGQILSELDEATKQAFVEQGLKDGYTVEFGADGTTTVTDQDGTVMIQNPDGSWDITDADGTIGQFGGDWPENDFTKQVPRPDFEITGCTEDENFFDVAFANVDLDAVKAYAEKLKKAGFTVDPDELTAGEDTYAYSAENKDGYEVELFYYGGASPWAGFRISKY